MNFTWIFLILVNINQIILNGTILPDNFDLEFANNQMIEAKHEVNFERANFYSQQINQHWLDNRVEQWDPLVNGPYDKEMSKIFEFEDYNESPNIYAPLWGSDIRIDPRDQIFDVDIVSISNGDMFAVAKHLSLGLEYFLIFYKSTDGGNNWNIEHEMNFQDYIPYEARIDNADDTLIVSYILKNPSGHYRPWVLALHPSDLSYILYAGGPISNYQDYEITDFRLTNSGPIYDQKYVFITWTETYGSGPDSTRIMFARSNGLFINSWELGPDVIAKTSGTDIYYYSTRFAYGGDCKLMIVSCLHPAFYPQTYDEGIRGFYSSNSGSSWGSFIDITPFDNHKNEYQPTIAGSHINDNWVVLVTQEDTSSITDKNLYNFYSTNNGTSWNQMAWVNPDSNFLADVYVDYNSNAFFAVFRKDLSNNTEEVRFKKGNISNPTVWTQSIAINDNTTNLSDTYGPKVCYRYVADEACAVWTDYLGSTYSIWFDNLNNTGVEEELITNKNVIMNVISKGKSITIAYQIILSGKVNLSIYDASGRQIDVLINENLNTGSYSIDYTPRISGVYYVHIVTSYDQQTEKSIILR